MAERGFDEHEAGAVRVGDADRRTGLPCCPAWRWPPRPPRSLGDPHLLPDLAWIRVAFAKAGLVGTAERGGHCGSRPLALAALSGKPYLLGQFVGWGWPGAVRAASAAFSACGCGPMGRQPRLRVAMAIRLSGCSPILTVTSLLLFSPSMTLNFRSVFGGHRWPRRYCGVPERRRRALPSSFLR